MISQTSHPLETDRVEVLRTRDCAGVGCTVELSIAIEAIASRWSLPVLSRLRASTDALRFTSVRQGVAGISQKELTRQLKHLVSGGFVERQVDIRGQAVHYRLTPRGLALLGALDIFAATMRAVLKLPAHADQNCSVGEQQWFSALVTSIGDSSRRG